MIGFMSIFFLKSESQIINVDKIDTTPYVKKAKWDESISSGLEIDKQKITLYDASSFLDMASQQYRELFIFSASNRFTYNGPQDFLNTGYLHLRWRHDYKAQTHLESYVQYSWDAKIGMKSRFVFGENVRYNFWHKKLWEMTFATGLLYENETWDYAAADSSKIPVNAPDIKTSFLKSNNYMKWEGKISENTSIAIAVFYQARFNDFFKPRVATNVNLTVEMTKHFSLELKYAGVYDSKPVVPIFNFYYSLSNNLVYKF
jgi:Protein of unknown function, DUF481